MECRLLYDPDGVGDAAGEKGTTSDRGRPIRTCLHCVLVRALRAEWRNLEEAGLEVTPVRGHAAWVPGGGGRVYRRLRRLLRDAREGAERGGRLNVGVVDQTGKSHIEVIAALRTRGRGRVFTAAFPRPVLATLVLGFAESAEIGAGTLGDSPGSRE